MWLIGLSGLAGVLLTGAPRMVRGALIVAGAFLAPAIVAVPTLFGLG